jgi:hypothetical protein
MKVATLTLPIHVNYGAVLQAFALHKALIHIGHEPFLLDIRPSIYKKSQSLSVLSFVKSFILRLKKMDSEYGNTLFENFINENLVRTDKIRFPSQLDRLPEYDAYIVGSDQVWRSEYALYIELFYFNFIQTKSLKISYAASFGKADWTYNSEQTNNCRSLLAEFTSVSVREESGRHLVKSKLNADAVHVLDPTFLVEPGDYSALIDNKSDKIFGDNDVFCYVLDLNFAKDNLISTFRSKSSVNKVLCNDGKSDKNKISIENWLQGIRDSSFVITDSFHGMVFCLIFQKEFLILANNSRGYERFSSLLGQLGLLDRLVDENAIDNFSSESLKRIDYSYVNPILDKMKVTSMHFLKQSLIK